MLPFDPQANFASTLMFEKISNFSKKYFFDRSKNILSDFGGFSKINQHVRISLRFSMCNNMQLKEIWKCCQIFEKCSQNLAKYFWIDRKIFFEKVEKIFEHKYRFKISLRIEWEHSQPLKITLKHSNFASKGKIPVLVPLSRANCTSSDAISLIFCH